MTAVIATSQQPPVSAEDGLIEAKINVSYSQFRLLDIADRFFLSDTRNARLGVLCSFAR